MVLIVSAVAGIFVLTSVLSFTVALLAMLQIEPFPTFVADWAPPKGVIPFMLYGLLTLTMAGALLRIALTVEDRKKAWRRREREIALAQQDTRTLWATPKSTPTTGDRNASRHPD